MGRIIRDRSEIEKILMKAKVGRLGVCLNNRPYVVPIGFVYHNGKIYFHSANKGRKIRIMKKNPLVCFETDECKLVPNPDPCKFTFHYRSAIVFGKVHFLKTKKEKLAVLNIMISKYNKRGIVKSLNESMVNGLVIGEISIQLMTGKRNP